MSLSSTRIKNFNEATRPLFKISKAFGLIYFNTNGKVSKLAYCYSILNLTFSIIANILIIFLLDKIHYYEAQDILLSFIIRTQLVAFVLTFTGSAFVIWKNNRQLYKLFLRFKLNQKYFIESTSNYRQIYRIIILELVIGSIIFFIYTIEPLLYLSFSWNSLFCGVVLGANAYFMYLADLCFANFMLLIWRSMKALNHKLEKSKNFHELLFNVNMLRRSHYGLCELTRELNHFFEPHLFLSMVQGFTQLGYCCYIILYNIIIDEFVDNDLEVSILWLFYYIIKLALIFTVCEEAVSEVSIILQHHQQSILISQKIFRIAYQ